MKRADRIVGFILILLAGFAYYRSYSFPSLEVTETGPALFPRIISIGIIFLSILLITKSFISKTEESITTNSYKSVILTIAIMVFYLFGFFYIGFFVTSVISLTLIMLVMGIRNKWTIILVTIISTLVIYSIFYYIFNVPLPEGILI